MKKQGKLCKKEASDEKTSEILNTGRRNTVLGKPFYSRVLGEFEESTDTFRKPKLTPVTLKMDPLLLKKLKMFVRKRGVSYSWYIRLLLAKGIEKDFALPSSLAEAPDFLVAGDFDADGHQDIVGAKKWSVPLLDERKRNQPLLYKSRTDSIVRPDKLHDPG